ncbi:MAG: nascent polypeptide-associated complex protein [Candidatus Odinarchaeota archaeon]|nr:nascent polypeptide-associated complex protein [Candidatus Odinarchaeota archaeon]
MVKRKVGKIRDRNLARMMKRMGLNMNELSDVTEVIIRLTDKELVLEKPQVIKMSVGGQDVFQITGIVEERELASEESSVTIELSEEDIQLVASQANVSLEEARAALEQTNGDLAQAIMLLKQRGI